MCRKNLEDENNNKSPKLNIYSNHEKNVNVYEITEVGNYWQKKSRIQEIKPHKWHLRTSTLVLLLL